MSTLQLMRRLGLSETQTEEAWAVLQKEKLETVDALRHIWSHTSDGRWQALSLDSNVKDDLMSYFESEMGVSYGKMQVPPKELCIAAGPAFAISTRGGQAVGVFRKTQ
ncbi:unnamed protein product [Symbiodinium sp. CCMP2456]|nr:unnamed protein product [Symbiodinium sp. CCMP2456]